MNSRRYSMKLLAHVWLWILLVGLFTVEARAQQSSIPVTDALPSTSSEQSGRAHEPDFIVPSRPTVSNPAEFQRPGVLQLEYGYSANFHARGTRLAQSLPMALRFAISRRFLFEVDSDNFVSQTDAGGMRATGVGDTQLGLQGVIVHETEKHPALAFAYYIKLPSASVRKGLGTGRVDHNFIWLISKNVWKTDFDFNASYVLNGRQNGKGFAPNGQAAFALSHGLKKRFGIQGELSGQSRVEDQPGQMFLLSAATYQLNHRAIFDAGVRFGLTPDAPHFGVFAGMTVGLADFYKKRNQ